MYRALTVANQETDYYKSACWVRIKRYRKSWVLIGISHCYINTIIQPIRKEAFHATVQ